MAVSTPQHVRAASIQDPIIRYKWDDWDLRHAELPVDEEFYSRLQGISQRADMAFALGTAEWIVYRFNLMCDDLLPREYLEAAWAQVVHWRYRSLNWDGDTNSKEWSGPVRMAVWRAAALTEFSVTEAEQDGSPARGAVLIASLARHVIGDPAPYEHWRERIMKRLETLYPFHAEDALGEVVPREALDPDFDFKPEQTELLVNRFLADLDYRVNPFLNAPQRMLEQGFRGTPYVFDIDKDRKARHNW